MDLTSDVRKTIQNSKHLKTYKSFRKNVESRRMVNITGQLINKPEFYEVRALKKKLTDYRNDMAPAAIDMSKPHTFRMA